MAAKQVQKILNASQAELLATELRQTEDPVNRHFDNIIIIDTGALLCISRTGADPLREVFTSRENFFKAYEV